MLIQLRAFKACLLDPDRNAVPRLQAESTPSIANTFDGAGSIRFFQIGEKLVFQTMTGHVEPRRQSSRHHDHIAGLNRVLHSTPPPCTGVEPRLQLSRTEVFLNHGLGGVYVNIPYGKSSSRRTAAEPSTSARRSGESVPFQEVFINNPGIFSESMCFLSSPDPLDGRLVLRLVRPHVQFPVCLEPWIDPRRAPVPLVKRRRDPRRALLRLVPVQHEAVPVSGRSPTAPSLSAPLARTAPSSTGGSSSTGPSWPGSGIWPPAVVRLELVDEHREEAVHAVAGAEDRARAEHGAVGEVAGTDRVGPVAGKDVRDEPPALADVHGPVRLVGLGVGVLGDLLDEQQVVFRHVRIAETGERIGLEEYVARVDDHAPPRAAFARSDAHLGQVRLLLLGYVGMHPEDDVPVVPPDPERADEAAEARHEGRVRREADDCVVPGRRRGLVKEVLRGGRDKRAREQVDLDIAGGIDDEGTVNVVPHPAGLELLGGEGFALIP
ncbi:hypothetical protein THAOC_11071, partial [Thalassiosira oceanica]